MQKVNHFSLRKTAMYGLTSCLIGIAFMGAGTTVKADENSGANTDIKTEKVQQKETDKPIDKVSQPANADQQKSSDTQEAISQKIEPTAKTGSASDKNINNKKPATEDKQVSSNKQKILQIKPDKAPTSKGTLADKIIARANEQLANKTKTAQNDTRTITRQIILNIPIKDGNWYKQKPDSHDPNKMVFITTPTTITQTTTFTRSKTKDAAGNIIYGQWDKKSVILPKRVIDNIDYGLRPTELEVPELTVTPDSPNSTVNIYYHWWEATIGGLGFRRRNISLRIQNIDGTYEIDYEPVQTVYINHFEIVKGGPGRFHIVREWDEGGGTWAAFKAPFIPGMTPDIKNVPEVVITTENKDQFPDVTNVVITYTRKMDKRDVTRTIKVINPITGTQATTEQNVKLVRIYDQYYEDGPMIPMGWMYQDNDNQFWKKFNIPQFVHYQAYIDGVKANTNSLDPVKIEPSTKSKTITITYRFKQYSEQQSKTVTRTIHFVDNQGKQLLEPVTQTVTFTRTKTQSSPTDFTYSDWQTNNNVFAPYQAPAIDGYIPDKASVAAQPVTANSQNINETITYTAIVQPTKPTSPTTPPTNPTEPTQASQATQPAPVHPTVPPTQPTKPSQQIPPKATNSPQVAKPGKSAKSGNVKPKATRGGKEGVSVEPQSEKGKNGKHKIIVLAQREQRTQKAEPLSTKPNKQAKTLPQTGQRNSQALAIGLAIVNLSLLVLAGLGLRKRKN